MAATSRGANTETLLGFVVRVNDPRAAAKAVSRLIRARQPSNNKFREYVRRFLAVRGVERFGEASGKESPLLFPTQPKDARR